MEKNNILMSCSCLNFPPLNKNISQFNQNELIIAASIMSARYFSLPPAPCSTTRVSVHQLLKVHIPARVNPTSKKKSIEKNNK